MPADSLKYKLVFLFFLAYQTYFITVFINTNELIDKTVSVINIPLVVFSFEVFEFAVLLSLLLLIRFNSRASREIPDNKAVLYAIYFYILYEFFCIFPLSYFTGIDTLNHLLKNLLERFYLILVPLFLWKIYPVLRNQKFITKWINISSIVLIFAGGYNWLTGNIYHNHTGEIRLLWGGAGIVFVAVFIFNFFTDRKRMINYFLIATSIIGIMLVNHRSAYLYFGATVLFGLIIQQTKNKRLGKLALPILFSSVLILFLIQNDFLWTRFTGNIAHISMKDVNAEDRFVRWALAFDYFLQHPINGSLLANQYYESTEVMKSLANYPPHNFVLELLSTEGIIGLAFYLFILYRTLSIAYRNRKDQQSFQLFLVLLFYILYATFNVTFLNKWAVLIMIVSISMILYRNHLLRRNESSLVHKHPNSVFTKAG